MIVPLTPIRCLYRGVDLYGPQTAIVCGGRRFSYTQFGERCERLAAGLLAEGVTAGDRVAYLSFNNAELLEGYYGAPLARAVVMPLNVRLTPAELISILNHAEARVLVFETDFAPLAAAIRHACPSIQRFVSIGGPVAEADMTIEELMDRGRIQRPDIFAFDEHSLCELFYTSGSTGTPKGVMLSHRTLYLHAMAVLACFYPDDTGVELHTIPLFHANGWGRPQAATMTGLKQVMVRRFEPTAVLRLIAEERATSMSMVPTMANALLQVDAGGYDVSCVREVMLGGAAAASELIARLERIFPNARVMVGYGLTETSPVATAARRKRTVTYADEADRLHHMAMAGWPIACNEVRVVDLHLHDVPRDGQSIGEVIIRGDNVMDGYYREPKATAAVMTDGWLHTGDMAVWDEETYIHIVDRQKDIIISGGENISSIEVEKAIFAHPAVLECAVVSAPDPQWGEVPAAFVVLKPGEHVSRDELLGYLCHRIARFKHPRIVEFLEEALPKTGTGKIVKRTLRERFWEGKERRVQG